MRRGVAATLTSVFAGLVLVGCSSSPSTGGGRWLSQVSGFGLDHAQATTSKKVWKTEVHRQNVKLNAVVTTLQKSARPGRADGCPAGPLLRIVIGGTFPSRSSSTTYEDSLATPDGQICFRTYQQTAPRLPGVPVASLKRKYEVPNSG